MNILNDQVLGITEKDYQEFDIPCVNDRRCLMVGNHTYLDHVRVGLAEKLLKNGGK